MAFELLLMKDPVAKNSFHGFFISLGTGIKLAGLVVFLVVLFAAQSLLVLTVMSCLSLFLAVSFGLGWRELKPIFAPFLAMAVIAVVAQLLYCKTGEVLFSVDGVAVYADALILAGAFLLRFVAAMITNVAFMACVSLRDLMGCLSALLSPLEKMGIRSAMFVMSLEAALVALPLLVEAFDAQCAARKANAGGASRRSIRRRLHDLGEFFADFFDRSFESINAVIVEVMESSASDRR